MSFFNKKEEVMEVQLTQYGKYLLSKGRFKPEFYAFSDDEILYDVSYGENAVEVGKDSFERIQNDTIRMRPLYEHEGAETRVLKLNKQILMDLEGEDSSKLEKIRSDNLYGDDIVDDNAMKPDDKKLMRSVIGTSELGNKHAPAWCVTKIIGPKFESPIHVSSSGPNIGLRRPQINMIGEHELVATRIEQGESVEMQEYLEQFGDESEVSFVDGWRMAVEGTGTEIILDIMEKNVSSPEGSNFEAEFFLIDGEKEIIENGKVIKEEILLPLHFQPNIDSAKDSLLSYIELFFDDEVVDDTDEIEFGEDDIGYEIGSNVLDDEDFCD